MVPNRQKVPDQDKEELLEASYIGEVVNESVHVPRDCILIEEHLHRDVHNGPLVSSIRSAILLLKVKNSRVIKLRILIQMIY